MRIGTKFWSANLCWHNGYWSFRRFSTSASGKPKMERPTSIQYFAANGPTPLARVCSVQSGKDGVCLIIECEHLCANELIIHNPRDIDGSAQKVFSLARSCLAAISFPELRTSPRKRILAAAVISYASSVPSRGRLPQPCPCAPTGGTPSVRRPSVRAVRSPSRGRSASVPRRDCARSRSRRQGCRPRYTRCHR
jgi:hypothetical protein